MHFYPSKKNLVLIFLLLSIQIPFLEYTVANLIYFDQIFRTLISLYLICLIIGIIISKIFNLLFNSKFNDYLFIYSITFFLIFKWFNLTLFIKSFFLSFSPFLSLFLILIIIFLTIYLLLFKKNKSLKSFINIFFLIYFIYLIFLILINTVTSLNYDKQSNINDLKISNNFHLTNKNIYFIIFDGMISEKRFENIYSSKKKLSEYYLKVDKFKSIQDVKSSYFDTGLTIGSIFNLNYISEDYPNNSLNNLYPGILYKKNLKKNEPKLIKILKKNNYNFIWYSNYITNCSMVNKNFCGKLIEGKFNQFVNIYVSINFLGSSPLIAFINKIDSNILLKLYHKKNDALKNFLNNSEFYEKKNKNFFFIHNLMPHAPFIYNEDCTLVNNEKNMTEGYKMNYLCALKRIREFQNFILSKDKDALVIIQADHGYFFQNEKIYNERNNKGEYIEYLYSENKNELLKNYEILTIIKNDECTIPKNIILDNVNSIIFAVNCVFKENLAYKEKKTFHGYNQLIN